jgi:hypothetical protein
MAQTGCLQGVTKKLIGQPKAASRLCRRAMAGLFEKVLEVMKKGIRITEQPNATDSPDKVRFPDAVNHLGTMKENLGDDISVSRKRSVQEAFLTVENDCKSHPQNDYLFDSNTAYIYSRNVGGEARQTYRQWKVRNKMYQENYMKFRSAPVFKAWREVHAAENENGEPSHKMPASARTHIHIYADKNIHEGPHANAADTSTYVSKSERRRWHRCEFLLFDSCDFDG